VPKKEVMIKQNMKWLDYLKIFIYGLIFAIIVYVLSGDTSSIVIGILVMYLEYKFMKLERVKK
jgi:hypothetical protein